MPSNSCDVNLMLLSMQVALQDDLHGRVNVLNYLKAYFGRPQPFGCTVCHTCSLLLTSHTLCRSLQL